MLHWPGMFLAPGQLKYSSLLTWCSSIFVGVFFSTLDTTIIGTALVSIVEELGSFWLSPWIVLAYLLTYMSKSPSNGCLAPPNTPRFRNGHRATKRYIRPQIYYACLLGAVHGLLARLRPLTNDPPAYRFPCLPGPRRCRTLLHGNGHDRRGPESIEVRSRRGMDRTHGRRVRGARSYIGWCDIESIDVEVDFLYEPSILRNRHGLYIFHLAG